MTTRESTLVTAALVTCTAILLRPSIHGHDGAGNYVYLRSVLIGRDLDFRDDYAAFDRLRANEGETRYRMSDAPVSGTTGLPANRYGVGAALFWAPFVVPVHAVLARIDPALADGLSPPYEAAVALGSACWAGLALWLLHRRLRRRLSASRTAMTLVGITFATPLAFYIWAYGAMSHAVSFFVATCAFLTVEDFKRERRPIRATLVGVWSGALVTVRVQDATWSIGLVVAVGVIAAARGGRVAGGRWTSPACLVGLCVAGLVVTLLPQAAIWKILNGSWLSGPAPYLNREGGSFSALPTHVLDALLSPRHGALTWHPILAFALMGLVTMAMSLEATTRTIGRLGLAAFAAQAWLVGCWSMWWAGASFGNRFFISSYPALAFGLSASLSHLGDRSPRWVTPAALTLLVAWNAGLLIQYGTEMIPRQEPVTFTEILTNQFTDVPAWISAQISSRW